MAITNQDRVGRALELLKSGLEPFIERELASRHGKYWISKVTEGWRDDLNWKDDQTPHLDIALLLRLMWDNWNDTFRRTLGQSERTLVSELRDHRNRWAHQEPFSSDDTYRALDSASRLLTSVSAPQAADLETMKTELLRLRFDEQIQSEKSKSTGTAIIGATGANLKPWREVVTPHRDVASGKYQQAEFAADIWQVYLGEGSDEYRDPVEFFRRTHLTRSLSSMLVGAIQRLAGEGGDPVIQLQTNFGGGKTHSMLALFHLFSGIPPAQLTGMDGLLKEAGVSSVQPARRVVLVGNKISPGNPTTKPDGTFVRTLWGELAWQLGGKEAFETIRADDEKATSPGDALRELFNRYGPCLILIDEWVAYARQLHDQSDLPAGGFETQFSFAQALTESAKLAKNCLLVISLPASDTAAGSPHTQADDVEVGGQRGREALDRLRNVVGRVESSWRPASAEEGFEIVRRRLFEPMQEVHAQDREATARAFADLYRTQHQEFPPECRDADYEKRLRDAYPIHPEIFDRLYTDWSTLVKFQRTRGVLRLMAAVIHSLWEKGDKNPLILPANISIDDPRVQFELTRYLSDNWVPVIEKDVDGPSSLPLRVDSDVPNLGKFSACRRVARTIYMGSAPLTKAAHRGVEDRRVKLGCVMPGESPAIFGDALRRLAGVATYLYQDGARYWYSTQPTVTKLAEDRAEQLKRDPDKVAQELEKRLKEDLDRKGDFRAIHTLPHTGQEVSDDLEARLVVLRQDTPYGKEANNPAQAAAKAILEFRGNTPRSHRNALVFLAADKSRLHELEEAARKYLAWKSILNERLELNLDPQQAAQAQTQLTSADNTVKLRIPETYQWLLVPEQKSPQDPITFQAVKMPSGQDPLAVRASKKLRTDESFLTGFAGTRLRMELDKVPLWRGEHVAVRQLVEDFASYLYLPRLQDPTAILVAAIADGVNRTLWEQETFAYADSHDEGASRYRGLRCGEAVSLSKSDLSGLVVQSTAARAQLDAELAAKPAVAAVTTGGNSGTITAPVKPGGDTKPGPTAPQPPRRYHGSVVLDPARVGRDAGKIAEEVISHLCALMDAKVKVTLEIEADIPSGAPPHVVRAVTENSQTLKFTSHGFEAE